MSKRKSTGKRQRFAIFARDQFTCRYCGEQPPRVKLTIDHVIPVVEGGTSDDENLITACEACNGGKGRRLLETIAPTDMDSARLAQECMEQEELAELTARAAASRQRIDDSICDFWKIHYRIMPTLQALARIKTLITEFGPEQVFEWLDMAYSRDVRETQITQYISGIARNVRTEGGGR
jgi:hypothetical protein